jgi:hypothetical protein
MGEMGVFGRSREFESPFGDLLFNKGWRPPSHLRATEAKATFALACYGGQGAAFALACYGGQGHLRACVLRRPGAGIRLLIKGGGEPPSHLRATAAKEGDSPYFLCRPSASQVRIPLW